MANDQRVGDWIQTYGGRQFWPCDPRPEEVHFRDIAHALSLLCRFGGHVERFYSVAEHCVLLSYAVPSEHALWALMHDASEAYVVDIPRPLKGFLGEYRAYEDRVIAAIAERFYLGGTTIPDVVSLYDRRILLDERDQLMSSPVVRWDVDSLAPLGVKVSAWLPSEAEHMYRKRFAELTS